MICQRALFGSEGLFSSFAVDAGVTPGLRRRRERAERQRSFIREQQEATANKRASVGHSDDQESELLSWMEFFRFAFARDECNKRKNVRKFNNSDVHEKMMCWKNMNNLQNMQELRYEMIKSIFIFDQTSLCQLQCPM